MMLEAADPPASPDAPAPWPLFRRLDEGLTVMEAFQRLVHLPQLCLLESAQIGSERGQYSFLMADPVDRCVVGSPQADPLGRLDSWLQTFATPAHPELPPFQGGAAGLLSYELGRCFERLPAAAHDEFAVPLVSLGLYDVVVAWDHLQRRVYLMSQGLPELTPASRRARAEQRLEAFHRLLTAPDAAVSLFDTAEHWQVGRQATAHGLTAPQFETRLHGSWLGTFDSGGFRQTVQRGIDYIAAGDIFQVNLAQRLMHPAVCSSPQLYATLRQLNPAPFAGYLDFGSGQLLSASPERFLKVRQGAVETRPIKGTRRRSLDPEEDRRIAAELLASSKDRSENVMIVDLMRNDLSRVCDVDSLQVTQLCALESYQHVHHLVSVVRGRLAAGARGVDLLGATFPGGSITGAPKIRAMEIIAELEPTSRGAYCGSLGYFGLDGGLDLNILIRSITACRGWWQLQVGGGIVIGSQPELEEEETWVKSRGLVQAVEAQLAMGSVR
jgi:para-aminobenzoate synthetase component 1